MLCRIVLNVRCLDLPKIQTYSQTPGACPLHLSLRLGRYQEQELSNTEKECVRYPYNYRMSITQKRFLQY